MKVRSNILQYFDLKTLIGEIQLLKVETNKLLIISLIYFVQIDYIERILQFSCLQLFQAKAI